MKFARYLEETQIPEWKRAYIDYRGIKKLITACRKEKERGTKRVADPQVDPHTVVTHAESGRELQPDDRSFVVGPRPGAKNLLDDGRERQPPGSLDTPRLSSSVHPPASSLKQAIPEVIDENESSSGNETAVGKTSPMSLPSPKLGGAAEVLPTALGEGSTSRPTAKRATTLNMGMLPQLRKHRTFRIPSSLRMGSAGRWELSAKSNPAWDPTKPISLTDLYPHLTSAQMAVFENLDAELDKVESFYVQREKETSTRVAALKAQLNELVIHKQEFQHTHPTGSWLDFPIIRSKAVQHIDHLRSPNKAFRRRHSQTPQGRQSGSPGPSTPRNLGKNIDATVENGDESSSESDSLRAGKKGKGPLQKNTKHDPEEYYHAKKKLKKAMLECYRGLEILNNYRTLNLIGFRKALKKFEKVTKIPVQQAYTSEKIDPNAFASPTLVERMLREMEVLYAARFTHGDKKKALTRLRGGAQHKNHHFSAFSSGAMLGLAIPALIDGLIQSFRRETREAIPAWDGLLYVYSLLFVPTLFALLVGLNIHVWATTRINYPFIFELELRTLLDHRQYYELPAFLLCALCYSFWFSFKRVGEELMSPTLWPLVWLSLVTCVMINPLSILFKNARYWLLKNSAKLLVSGTRRVEFTDFWLGDQFCSLVFTLSNLYFIPCAYSRGLGTDWRRCTSSSPRWWISFLLASLPLLARAIQSVRRYYDSKLTTHLINGGKYFTGIVYYFCYCLWRHQGGGRSGSFVAWVVFGSIYSTYAGAWDILMDWSLFRSHAKYPLLRPDILYTSSVPAYYFALVSNSLLRFSWVFYIPERGPNFMLRTFIAGMLEILRRWQWNFFRLENEHLGNVDQYRVTREVPLPYTIREDDTDDEDNRSQRGLTSLRWRRGVDTSTPRDGSNAQ